MYDSKSWNRTKAQMTDTLRQGVSQGMKMGADEIQLVGKISAIKNLSAENKEITLASSNESQDIGVKVHKDLKKGTTSLNRLSTKEVTDTIGSALDIAKISV
jgi:predicted Zn-dependent protease